MGSLAYALGGGMAGLGQGMAEVGKEAQKEQLVEKESDLTTARETTLQRLRAAEEEKLQASGQTFQHGETQEKLTAAVGAASATRQHETEENEKNRKAAQTRAETSANARVDAAYLNHASPTSKTGGVKPLQSVKVNIVPQGPDGKPILGALPEQHVLTYDPNTGLHWVQQGGNFYRAGSDGKPVVDPQGLNRKPAAPGEKEHMLANPYAIVPAAYKNGGMTYAESYEKEHGSLPAEWLGATNKLAQAALRPTSVRLPGSGRTVQMPEGGGGGGAENPQQEQNDESDGPSNFQSGANTTFNGVAGD